MGRKRLSVLATCALLASCSLPDAPTDVVFIVVDTLRADAAGPRAMPNVEALARDGVRFSAAFSHAPLTLPAHTALFSARLASSSRVTNNGQAVDTGLPLLAEHLAARGYQTQATTSLATLWPVRAGRGLDRGFDAYGHGEHEVSAADEVTRDLRERIDAADPERPLFLFAHYSDPHQPYNAHGTSATPATIALDGVTVDTVEVADMTWWKHTFELEPGEHSLVLAGDSEFHVRTLRIESDGGRITTSFGDAQHAARREHRLVLSHDDPGPVSFELIVWLHDAPDVEEIRRRYRLEVAAVDRAVGELVDHLKRAGRYEDSLIVFTSDHGEGLGEHGTVGHARHLYDELLGVPLIIKPPKGHARTGDLARAASRLARHVDVVPTVLELLDLSALDDCDGVSLLGEAERVLAAEAHPPEAPRSLYALRDLEHKLVYDAGNDRFELYRVSTDPGELEDVHDVSDARFEPWRERLRARAEERVEVLDPTDAETRRRMKVLGY